MIPVLYSATVWLEWQYNYSATVPSQFYGANVLRLQFYWPNVRVPDTTEPRTWLIRQSASLLPPFAAVMSPSPPREMDTVLPPLLIISEIDTILPPLLLFVIPSNHQVPAPYLPFLLCSSYFPLSNPATTTTTTTTSSREEKTQWSVLLQLLQRKV